MCDIGKEMEEIAVLPWPKEAPEEMPHPEREPAREPVREAEKIPA